MTRIPLLVAAAIVAACDVASDAPGNATPPAADTGKASAAPAERSPGKPSAPVEIRYQVLGTPRVGQPVAIELELVSTQLAGEPLRLRYAINDGDSLLFAAEQPLDIALSIPEDAGVARRQVTVVPQREGRLYVTVTAELDTDTGTMLKSIAVPLSVGRGDAETGVNGRLEEAAGGETVVSMPAREN